MSRSPLHPLPQRLASEAWALAHEWRIVEQLRHCALTEDTRAFVSWAASYAKRVEALGALDPARLTDAVTTLVRDGRLSVAGEVLLVGFDELSPQQSALFESFAARGSRCEHCAGAGGSRGGLSGTHRK
jgi:ATP-dependent helicase/nuclease subunit B